MELSTKILSDITVYMKYAKYLPELKRRENWDEIVGRNVLMHTTKFPDLATEIYNAYKLVYDKKVLPSMRSLQFAGKPIAVNPTRIFNCSFLPIDDYRAFSETMFLLLGGVGVGFSVQNHHVEKLPDLKKPNPNKTSRYLINDSIEGWADAIKMLIKSYFNGSNTIRFDYSDIRPKGARLITAGGKAPGPQPLKDCIHHITKILNDKETGDKLAPIDCHDIICHIADAVLAGGIRRAALISLFNADDIEMLNAKTGNWWELNPQRGRANNSAVLLRHKITQEFFLDIWKRVELSGAGEPGIYLSNEKDWGSNPCCFTGDTLIAVADGRNAISIKDLAEESDGKKKFAVYSSKRSTISNQFGDSGKFKKWKPEISWAVAFKTGSKKIIRLHLSDGNIIKCTPDHLFALPNGEYIQAKDLVGQELQNFFTFRRDEFSGNSRNICSYTNGGSKQHLLMWKFFNGEIPKGYVVDHIVNNKKDFLNNLQLLTKTDHDKKSGSERLGENNGIHKVINDENYRKLLKYNSFGLNNANAASITNEEIVELAKQLRANNSEITIKNLRSLNSEVPQNFSRHRFGGKISNLIKVVDGEVDLSTFNITPPENPGAKQHKIDCSYSAPITVVEIEDLDEVEDVYDLNVEGNENFYIITESKDANFVNCKGVLVHNCEIALRPFQFCNLCEINASNIESEEDFIERVKAATLIGTLQATYTDFHYLRPIWQKTTEKDALIGISMTGIASNVIFNYDLEKMSKLVVSENKRIAKILGIKSAARTTCVKPSGTTSLVLGTSSGIHAWHNDYYVRRIRVNKNEAIYTYLKENHPELVEDEYFRPHDTAVISIPQKAPANAILRTESPLETLDRVSTVYNKWIKPGHNNGVNTHNVSATISIKNDEWDTIGEWMWKNRQNYNGLSVLPYSDHTYIQAPFEDISQFTYNKLETALHSINLDSIIEFDDETNLTGELACAGGNCEVS